MVLDCKPLTDMALGERLMFEQVFVDHFWPCRDVDL